PCRIFPPVSSERTRARTRKEDGLVPTGGRLPSRNPRGAYRSSIATLRLRPQNPFLSRPDSTIPPCAHIASSLAVRSHASPPRRPGAPLDRGCSQEFSPCLATACSSLSCRPGTRFLFHNRLRARRRSWQALLARRHRAAREYRL